MNDISNPKLLVLIFILLPVFQSCAEMKNWVAPKSPVEKSAPAKVPSKSPAQTADRADKHSVKASPPAKDFSQDSVETSSQAPNLAKKHMEAGEYQKAIDAYDAEYRKHPHDQALVREYVKSMEDISSAADKALDQKDFSSAGRRYDVLLRNHARFKGLEKKLSFNSTHLDEKLGSCKKAMFKQGFQEYRKGNLGGAIELWQDLLAIDPKNTDAQKALKTAKLQQKNLKEKE